MEGPEAGDGALGQWRRHLAEALPGLAVHDAAVRLAEIREELDVAAGLTRQSAHERWGAAFPPRSTDATTMSTR